MWHRCAVVEATYNSGWRVSIVEKDARKNSFVLVVRKASPTSSTDDSAGTLLQIINYEGVSAEDV